MAIIYYYYAYKNGTEQKQQKCKGKVKAREIRQVIAQQFINMTESVIKVEIINRSSTCNITIACSQNMESAG